MRKRFFAFGCSFTKWNWPTWADILSKHYQNLGYQTVNGGVAGIGNAGIVARMHIANAKYKFTEDDIIAVLWSTMDREDKIIRRPNEPDLFFVGGGSISNNADYGADYVKKYWTSEGAFLQSIMAISAANSLFPIKAFGQMLLDEAFTQGESALLDSVQTKEQWNPLKNKFDYNLHTSNHPHYQRISQVDGHPLPLAHLKFAQDVICPQLGIPELTSDIIEWVTDWDYHSVEVLDTVLKKELSPHEGFSALFALANAEFPGEAEFDGTNDIRILWDHFIDQYGL